jgi:SNF2 family DNA or RNA helicase
MKLDQELRKKYPFLAEPQIRSVARALCSPSYGFFWDTGTGKTLGALTLIKEIGLPAIVVASSTVIPQWIDKNREHGFNIPYQVVAGKDKKRREEMWTNLAPLSFTTCETLREDWRGKRFHPYQNFVLVIDEASSKIKNRKTANARAMREIRMSRGCVYAATLTGTPVENRLEDTFSILEATLPNFMTPSEFYRNYCVFDQIYVGRDQFGRPKKRRIVCGYKNLEVFKNRISTISDRITKEEMRPYLPQKSWEYRFVDPTPVQNRASDSLISYARENGLKFVEIFQLLRVLSDGMEYFHLSDSRTARELLDTRIDLSIPSSYKNPKLEELKRILDEISGQVVIFTQFARVATSLNGNVLGREKVGLVVGHHSMKQRAEIVGDFKSNHTDILVCDDVLAYGTDLPDVDYVVNFDIHPNPAVMKQRSERIHRFNSERGKTIISMVSGVEQHLYDILKRKFGLFEEVVEKGSFERVNINQLLAEKYGLV